MEKIFPVVLIILNFLAAVIYAATGDVRHAAYWLAAAVLTISVTF